MTPILRIFVFSEAFRSHEELGGGGKEGVGRRVANQQSWRAAVWHGCASRAPSITAGCGLMLRAAPLPSTTMSEALSLTLRGATIPDLLGFLSTVPLESLPTSLQALHAELGDVIARSTQVSTDLL